MLNYYKASRLFLTLLVVLCSTSLVAFAQNCGCNVTIKPSQANKKVNIIDGQKAPYNRLKPGNTLCIQAGSYQELRFINFRGSGGKPITIKNCGGQVRTNDGIAIIKSRYIKFSGTGHPSVKYGIKILRAKGTGLNVTGLSSNVEIENVEIQNTGFAGIMVKTDPQCNQPQTWRKNYTFYDLKIHDCYIHDTHGEGMYIGYTGGFERSNKKCNGRQIFGHLFKSVRIHDNLIVKSGWDGFQLSLAVQDVQVYRNTVIGYGTKKVVYQNFGWSIGGGTRGKFYSNFIYQLDVFKQRGNPQNFKGSGIQIISNRDTFFYNNVIVNSERHGVFIHNRLSRNMLNFKEGYYFINNTIVGSGLSGIFYNSASTLQKDEKLNWRRIFYNNLVVGPKVHYERNRVWKNRNENYIDFNTKNMRDRAKDFIQKNIFAATPQEIKFAQSNNLVIDAYNYRLSKASKAVNAGLNASRSFGVHADFNEISRKNDRGFDIGAFEYSPAWSRRGASGSTAQVVAKRVSGNKVTFQCLFTRAGNGSITIEHLGGRKVHQLFSGRISAGTRNFSWNNAQRGLFRIKIKIDNRETSKFIKI